MSRDETLYIKLLFWRLLIVFTFQALICLSNSHRVEKGNFQMPVVMWCKIGFTIHSSRYCNVEFKLILFLFLNKLWSNNYTVIEQHLVKSIDFIWFSAFIKSSLRLLCIVATLKHFAAKRHLSVAKCTKWRLLLKTKSLDAMRGSCLTSYSMWKYLVVEIALYLKYLI